jgi:c-di-GMP-binding flagellar brake protein YcgR
MATATQDYDILNGPKVDELLFQLFTDGNLIRVSAPEHDGEHLATICEIRPQDDVFEFQLEITNTFSDHLKKNSVKQLVLEFTAKDLLPHRFKSQIRSIGPTGIWLHAPEYIQRYQFRSNFRIKVPQGAQFKVFLNNTDVEMTIDNISMGGAYCFSSQEHKPLVVGTKRLKNGVLFFTRLADCVEVFVKTAQMKRYEIQKRAARIGVAYEFLQMETMERKKLLQQIYEFQREYLKKRVRIT